MVQNIGFTLIGLGVLALIGWSVKGFFLAEEIPLFLRIAVGVIGAGVIILLAVAVRDRFKNRKKDDEFKEVRH